MTTIQYFPSLRDYTDKSLISRNGVRINISDFLYEWNREDYAYDYFYLNKKDGYYRLNYNIITYLLINNQQLFLNNFTKSELLDFIRDNIFFHSNPKIKAYENYMEKTIWKIIK